MGIVLSNYVGPQVSMGVEELTGGLMVAVLVLSPILVDADG
jgi:hypothetical protein